MKKIISLILLLSMSSALMAQTTTYRDNLGRKTGTDETKGNGTTYRDNVGRKQGSSTTRR